MNNKIYKTGIITMVTALLLAMSSCDSVLDLNPVSQITPETYYQTGDQIAAYLNNYYYSEFKMPFSGQPFHEDWTYSDGMDHSDGNCDIFCNGRTGSTTYYADDHWQVPSGKTLQGNYWDVRVYNYLINKVEDNINSGVISDASSVNKYLGEAYFFRALVYFRILAYYGDAPIIKTPLSNNEEEILSSSHRAPRNEVARFILEDLDKAISMLPDKGAFNGQRVNKQAALLFKSRVALFEATFEKYHKGSGRVPGDENWPGAKMPYNSGKTFDSNSEVRFFLQQTMDAAKQVGSSLTENNHVIEPKVGTISGWNPYFEMYSQASLSSVPEVLFWKQYKTSLDGGHFVVDYVQKGGNDGFTRIFTQSFLMRNGLPIYASNSGYSGDKSIDDVVKNRDERLQLFVWTESSLLVSDPKATNVGIKWSSSENAYVMHVLPKGDHQVVTGYQPRKYYSYNSSFINAAGDNACPVFRTAEAMLNYMEACYELNGSLDETAKDYWRALRSRAGVSTDFEATIAATDLSKEEDFAVYSGTQMVDRTLYNIRRERMNETFCEGLRMADLIRWRSFDRLTTKKWIPEGVNFWDETYKAYGTLIADGSDKAQVSSKEQSKYIRPYSKITSSSNELRDGYNWHEAYYLNPIGIGDLQTASPDRDISTSSLYQNVNWPTTAGGYAEK